MHTSRKMCNRLIIHLAAAETARTATAVTLTATAQGHLQLLKPTGSVGDVSG